MTHGPKFVVIDPATKCHRTASRQIPFNNGGNHILIQPSRNRNGTNSGNRNNYANYTIYPNYRIIVPKGRTQNGQNREITSNYRLVQTR